MQPSARLRVALCVAAFVAAARAQVPSPEQFLGHTIGEDRYLCNYTDLVRYWRVIEAATPRVRLHEIGTSSYGQKMLMAVITSPDNHRRLEELRRTSVRLCRAEDADESAARSLVQSGKAVVWIDAGLHATEAIAGQNILEFVWQMASRDDAEVRRILDEVVVLACPVNPDGLELVANAYMATGSMNLPVLYQRWIGHDNNRDFYICNQVEAENVSRVFFRQWCPQIVYNHHQTAPAGTIIFTPPFRDPFNYNADPNVIRGIEVVSAQMNARFAREGKPGVISRSGAPYSGWWNGGLRSTCYFHNIIGILTESFGRPEPTTITQSLDRRLPYGDYPDPVPTQIWHARQTIDYLQTANFAILEYAARYREELLFGIWRMGRNSIERGQRDHWTPTPRLVAAARAREEPESVFADPLLRDPRVYVLPRGQRDFAAAVRFVRALQKSGVDVLRATKPFLAGGVTCEPGSFVVRAAQAYRPHVIDQFEPQWHPDDIRDGKPVPPYDAAGWTLALQFGVDAIRCFDALDGPFEPLGDALVDFPAVDVAEAGAGWRIDAADTNAVIAVNRLLAARVRVERMGAAFFVPAQRGVLAAVRSAVADLGVRAEPLDTVTTEVRPAYRAPRIGLFDVFGGNMATGWDQWLLQQYGFDVQLVFGDRIAAGHLRDDFDVLVFHNGLPAGRDLDAAARGREPADLDKLAAALPPFEDWSTMKSRAVRLESATCWPAVREFVEHGGSLLALGGECEKLVRQFELPVRVGTWIPDAEAEGGERRTRREEFYVPGSLVALEVAPAHPFAMGSRRQPSTMFNARSPVLEVTGAGASVVAAYRTDEVLTSGWAIGEAFMAGKAAIVDAPVGEGRIVLFGADLTFRAQPVATFKLLFHAILSACCR